MIKMIRMMNISNIESFLKLTDASRGDVLVQMPDGSSCSLKNDKTARDMLKLIPISNAELDIQLTDSKDLPAFIYYMMTDCA